LRIKKKGKGGGLGTRAKASEPILRRLLAFLKPADASTERGPRSFLRQAVVQTLTVLEDISSSGLIRDVAGGSFVGRGQLSFQVATVRLAAASSEVGEITCV
jgi:hypothetical protein